MVVQILSTGINLQTHERGGPPEHRHAGHGTPANAGFALN